MIRAAKFRAAVCLAALLTVASGGRVFGQQPDRESERLVELARQLDADEFLARELAMAALLKAGPPALPALKSVLASGSLEATSRAFHVLRELGLAANFDENDEAWALLSELAERKELPTIARRATAALAELRQRRSAQALAELEGLGAKISRNEIFNGLVIDNPITSLEVGLDFRGQESDLWRLKWVIEVPQVVFAGEKVTDDWVKRAAAMPGLEELHLYQTRISDAGLAPLAGHASLEQLGIYYTPITDEGLKPLEKLPVLNFLKLYGTKATAQKATELRNNLGLAIDDRRGAFLGVSCSTIDGSSRISNVHKGSPADTAGLAIDDTIVRFGETAITTFDTLTAQIGQHAPGDEVEIEVNRRGFDKDGVPTMQNVVAKVKFTPWELKPAVDQPRRR